MIAIRTRYHGPTNTKGARISATDGRGHRVSIDYPHELSGLAVHAVAVEKLCAKMKWAGELAGGIFDDGNADAFWCFVDGDRANQAGK